MKQTLTNDGPLIFSLVNTDLACSFESVTDDVCFTQDFISLTLVAASNCSKQVGIDADTTAILFGVEFCHDHSFREYLSFLHWFLWGVMIRQNYDALADQLMLIKRIPVQSPLPR